MKKYFALFILLTPLLFSHAQNKSYFVGINPSVTVEPYYEEGELDVNVFPFVFQRPINLRTHVRLTSIVNLGIRNNANKLSHYGFEAAVPVFIRKVPDYSEINKGFFVAPIVSGTRNNLEDHTNLGLWVEPGYHLIFEKNFAMSFGLQLGGTYFFYDDKTTALGGHFGVKIVLGFWKGIDTVTP